MKLKTKKEEVVAHAPQTPVAGETPQTSPVAVENGKTAEVHPPATSPVTPPPLPPQPHPAEERLLRMQADFNNLRKRFDRERLEMTTLSNERLIKELLPAMDHLEMAINAAAQHKTEKAVQDGFRLVYDQLSSVLNDFGLKSIDATGEPFDPNFHEAISQQPSTEVPENFVMLQTRRGYQLGERLLRAAQVIVSCGPAQTASAPAKE